VTVAAALLAAEGARVVVTDVADDAGQTRLSHHYRTWQAYSP
jgi:hypothetical protein